MNNVFIEENGVYRHPMEDKKILIAARKFYDSLHYLRLLDKNKPIQYIYILEYPNGDATTRKRLRGRLKVELPFVLQDQIGNGKRLIDQVDVLSMMNGTRTVFMEIIH